VSLQFSILKVLAGQPGGRATVANLNRTITLLNCPEGTARMKRLSDRAPDLDIFGSRYVVRDAVGWELAEAGRCFLAAAEIRAAATDDQAAVEVILAPNVRPSTVPVLRLVANNEQGRRCDRPASRSDRSLVA
jgi:hypothetical protein